jgi:ribonuclease-3
MNNEWNTNPRILEDAIESLIGAIFLDSDLHTTTKFVLNIVNENMNDNSIVQDTNYKDILMKLMQSKGYSTPVYLLKTENGPDHNKIFTVQVTVDGKVLGEGYEKNKKKAEQMASKRVLLSFSLID